MGCDIHIVLEKKYADRWVGINNFDSPPVEAFEHLPKKHNYFNWRVRGRYYDLFARLAGVRGVGPEPRGLPPDISELTQMEVDMWGSDGHSHSWGMLEEVAGLFLAACAPQHVLEKDREEASYALFGLDIYPEDAVDYRIVYWFDN